MILAQNKNQLELIQKHDPHALSLVAEDRGNYYFAKRIMDVVIAAILLGALSPLLFLIMILMVLFSPGPIFYVQERVGARKQMRDGHWYWKKVTFSCYKFRTMTVNADPSIHQAYVKALIDNDTHYMSVLQGWSTEIKKLVQDSRVTRLGKYLRKLSLDELPQLWNVLRGDMSLVGPRPAIPYEVEMYKLCHLQRLEAQPGITGLQQVTARSIAGFDQQVKLDIEYIKKQSLWLDIKIILKTPLVIISTRGAE